MFGFGSVFRVAPAGVFTVLNSLTPAEGSPLFTHLIKGTDGYFYGNFQSGGGAGIGFGTIVRLDTSGTITVVHRFSGGLGGFAPESGLLQASDGNFYGTTWGGGASGNGTLYRLQPDGSFTIRHSFSAAGGEALRTFRMRLIEDAAGNLYGSADRGIFVSTPEGTVRLLHYVELEAGKDRYGSFLSALTLGDDGNLYGTAGSSSSPDVSSRIFRLNTRRSPCANLVELRWTPEIVNSLRITNVVKSETPAVWGTWFIFEDGTAVQLWMRNLPAITPTSVFYVPVRIPPSGTVSVVTVLVTSSLDVCSDVKSIDTGGSGIP
jgi:uncharacterized repeat protein (TIGR03803 family)